MPKLTLTMATAKKDTIYFLSIVVMVLSGFVHYLANIFPGGWLVLVQAIVGVGSITLGLLGAPVPLLVREHPAPPAE